MIALYPGTFDPVTHGHADIIKRASKMFDAVHVVILNNGKKSKTLFAEEERLNMVKSVVDRFPNVSASIGSGLLVHVCQTTHSTVIVRGLRGIGDLEHEMHLAEINHRLDSDIETIFLPARPEMQIVSSSNIKEMHFAGAEIASYVNKYVYDKLLSVLEQ